MSLSRTTTTPSENTSETNVDLSEYEERHNDSSFASTNGYGNESHVESGSAEDEASHIRAVEAAMTKLKQAHSSEDWKRLNKGSHGVDVAVQKNTVEVNGKQVKVPLLRGQKVIEGFTPQAVFQVAGQRDLWDDWYSSGNFVVDLAESTSLTYMVMNIPSAPTRPRDMALVERVELGSDGTIYFVATSVRSARIPPVHGRARATMLLNGFVMRPIQKNGVSSTWLSYYLQVDPAGLLAQTLAGRMLSKRPAAIYKIEQYLQKGGPIPNHDDNREIARNGSVKSAGPNGSFIAAGPSTSTPSKRREQKEVAPEGADSPLIPHVAYRETASSSKVIQQSQDMFQQLLSERQWEKAVDNHGSPICFRRDEKAGLPATKGEAIIEEDYTTEQVLATIASPSARTIWDDQFSWSEITESQNGADQAIYRDTWKGVHPHVLETTFTLAKAVLRQDARTDDGVILYLGRSTEADKASVDVWGWKIQQTSRGTEVSHAAKLDLGKNDLPDFVEKIYTTAGASGPSRVKSFLKQYGHPPFFLRWGEGKAQFFGEMEDSDIARGRVGWTIKAGGESSQQQQLAWLQWDKKMYPKGIALSASPDSACHICKIDGMANTTQITFKELPSSGMTLHIVPGSGSASDITFNGKKVEESVPPPSGAAIQRKAPAKQVDRQPAPTTQSDLPPDPYLVDHYPTRDTRSASTSAAGGLVAMLPSKEKLESLNLPQVASDLTTLHHPRKLDNGRRELPDDAMLIITRDLYFTRSQMAVISVLMAIVWSLAKAL